MTGSREPVKIVKTLNDRQSDISLTNSEKLKNLSDLNYDIFNKRLHLQT